NHLENTKDCPSCLPPFRYRPAEICRIWWRAFRNPYTPAPTHKTTAATPDFLQPRLRHLFAAFNILPSPLEGEGVTVRREIFVNTTNIDVEPYGHGWGVASDVTNPPPASVILKALFF